MATGSSAAHLTIRRATLDDPPQLRVLVEQYYDEWNVLQRDPPERIAEYVIAPEPCGFLVAEQESTLACCVLLRELPGLESALECKRLYVLPEYRGHGLA
jgi:N-acetylglutamate synthase-like GNAT family acetyltransferase